MWYWSLHTCRNVSTKWEMFVFLGMDWTECNIHYRQQDFGKQNKRLIISNICILNNFCNNSIHSKINSQNNI